jgi:multiple sugar transport system ATP-binding protein
MVFQSYALYPHLSVYENIAFPLRVQKMEARELEDRVKRAGEILQLTDKLHLKPGQLSGGQRQRVAIGRSIVRNPKVFLFDEPLSNLDAALRGDMRVELSQLHSDLDATMVYVTHDQVEAMTMADRIVVLNGGRIEQFGTPMELYHRPETKFVASFIGQPNMNLIPSRVIEQDSKGIKVELDGGTTIELPVQEKWVTVGDRVDVGIRPEHVTLSTEGIALSVNVIERLGGTSIAYGTVGKSTKFCATLPGNTGLEEGRIVKLAVTAPNCHVFDESGKVLYRNSLPELIACPT